MEDSNLILKNEKGNGVHPPGEQTVMKDAWMHPL